MNHLSDIIELWSKYTEHPVRKSHKIRKRYNEKEKKPFSGYLEASPIRHLRQRKVKKCDDCLTYLVHVRLRFSGLAPKDPNLQLV